MLSDTNRIVLAICRCILFQQSSVLFSFQDEMSATTAFNIAKKLCRNNKIIKEVLNTDNNNIYFNNESCLTFEFPKQKVESEHIRGQKSKLPLLYCDDFYIDEEVLKEVLKPYIKRGKTYE